MSKYSEIARLVDKEMISMKELRALMHEDLVKSVMPCKEDKRRPGYPKYEIRLTNEEIYWVYIKKNTFIRALRLWGSFCARLFNWIKGIVGKCWFIKSRKLENK